MVDFRPLPGTEGGGFFTLLIYFYMPIEVTAEELGGLLFSIHEHGKVAGEKGNQIVYKESDIIKLLTKLGYPLPVWGKVIRIDEFNPVPYPRG